MPKQVWIYFCTVCNSKDKRQTSIYLLGNVIATIKDVYIQMRNKEEEASIHEKTLQGTISMQKSDR